MSSSIGGITRSSDHCRVAEMIQGILRPEDRNIQTVRLEGGHVERSRFLSIVCNETAGEYCLLGTDCCSTANKHDKSQQQDCDNHNVDTKVSISIGLVVKILWDPDVKLDGDGGFSVRQCGQHYIFKPISVQALWTIIQTLHMIAERLTPKPYSLIDKQLRSSAPTAVAIQADDDWVKEYEKRISSSQSCLNEWHEMPDLIVRRPRSPDRVDGGFLDREEINIKSNLRNVMKAVDLDNVTSKVIRKLCEEEMGESLEEHKSFIDEEILVILGQMDPASKILDYLYLGSEWNASHLDELRQNNITHILNVTREIDNFFPAVFQYKNIRVYDEEVTDLLKHFDSTYKFIREAKEKGGAILVHCKMGISRSASVVSSYMMKEYEMDLEQTLIHVQERRSIVNPNKGFIKQLEVYEGMLGAIRLRLTYYGRIAHLSKSESSLVQSSNSDQLSNGPECSDNTRLTQDQLFTSVNVKAMSLAFSNAFSTISNPSNDELPNKYLKITPIRPTSEPLLRFRERPKSWSPNEGVSELLLGDEGGSFLGHDTSNSTDFLLACNGDLTTTILNEGKNEKLFILPNKSAKLNDESSDDILSTECTCFNDLAQNCEAEYSKVITDDSKQIGNKDYITANRDTDSKNCDTNVNSNNTEVQQLAPTTPTKCQKNKISVTLPSPVNSASNAYNPDCDCNVEVELKVPEEPVKILDTHPDIHTDTIVKNLANVPLQIRSSPLLEKHQLKLIPQEKDNISGRKKKETQSCNQPNRSLSHPPITNNVVNNLISHYYPAPYSSSSSLNSTTSIIRATTSFKTSSITSSTSSLTSLSTSSSSPTTPSTFVAPSSEVQRRSSAAGDFSGSSNVVYQQRKRVSQKRVSLVSTYMIPSSNIASVTSVTPPLLPSTMSVKCVKSMDIQKSSPEESKTASSVMEKSTKNVRKENELLEEEPPKTNKEKEVEHIGLILNCSGDDGQVVHDDKIVISSTCHENEFRDESANCKQDELSVKTLANLFDFKNTTIPTYKQCPSLEDNVLFQRGRQSDHLTTTASMGTQVNESEC